MKLPNFVSSSCDGSSEIGHDFSNKVVQKLKLSTNHFYKKCAHKQLFFNEKKFRKIRTIFDIKNSLESPKLALFDKLSPDGDSKSGNFI